MNPAVVLLSGGLDSATALAIARAEGYETHALSFHYGQRHERELASAGEGRNRWGPVNIELRKSICASLPAPP